MNLKGFTLLEMLIAIWLGALLITHLITTFIIFNHDLNLQLTLVDIQQRGEFISHFFTEKIHLAGDSHCLPHQWVNQNQAISGSPLQLGECVRYHDVLQFKPTQYFIADSGRKDNRGRSIKSLFMKIEGSEREELIENIKQMQVVYGVSKPGMKMISAYLSADQITHWQWVRSVDITLVLEPFDKVWHIYATLRERS